MISFEYTEEFSGRLCHYFVFVVQLSGALDLSHLLCAEVNGYTHAMPSTAII
jgi:hypothetical protein